MANCPFLKDEWGNFIYSCVGQESVTGIMMWVDLGNCARYLEKDELALRHRTVIRSRVIHLLITFLCGHIFDYSCYT
jgi:hypothetical protein